MRLARWLLLIVMFATPSALAAPAKHPTASRQPRPAQDTAQDTAQEPVGPASPSGLEAPAASQPPANDKLDAKALMQSGLKLYAAKDFLGALAVFKTAYARFASTKILLNIGTTLTKLDRKAEAANAYQRYLDAADSDRAKHGEVKKVLGELDTAVTLLELDITPGEAELQINDEDWTAAASTTRHRVAPGPVTVRARHPAYQPDEHVLRGTAGARLPVAIALAELPPAPPPPAPRIIVDQGIRVATPAPVEPPRSRIGMIAVAHVDVYNLGGAGRFGIAVDVTRRLELQAAALLGTRVGGYAAASLAIIPGKLRPVLTAGLPIFMSNGARYSVRGAGGVEIEVSRHLTLIAEIGVEHLLNPEPALGAKPVLVVPAIGAAGRL